jgi:8-oxo-dGTP pyrophosphatase MutT (NUDIX family)
MSKEVAAYSAVALIESADSYIVHSRPSLKPEMLAYAGRYQFLGGHRDMIDTGLEAADLAITRELSEETNLGKLSTTRFNEYAHGLFEGLGKNDEPVTRDVTCFHLGLTAVENAVIALKKREGGELIRIPKHPDIIDVLADRLAPFAYQMLAAHVKGITPKRNEGGYLYVPAN